MRAPGRGPLFLKRGSYRKRRLRDAARMLPVLGAFLFALPMLWGDEGTASDGVYIFGVWFFLVLSAAAMARGLAGEVEAGEAEDARDGRGSGEG